jgi:DNA-binding NtrC family response regulator
VIEASDFITWDSLPASVRAGAAPATSPIGQSAAASTDDSRVSVSVPLDFQSSKEAFEREFLIQALKKFKGRINQTALQANIPKKTLLRKLEKYGINARDYSGG